MTQADGSEDAALVQIRGGGVPGYPLWRGKRWAGGAVLPHPASTRDGESPRGTDGWDFAALEAAQIVPGEAPHGPCWQTPNALVQPTPLG